jgi:hypothetical protein
LFDVAGRMSCPLTVTLVGNVAINSVTVQGDSNNCSWPHSDPGDVLQCMVWRDLSSPELTNDTFALVTSGASGVPGVSVPLPSVPGCEAIAANPAKQVPVVGIVATADKATVGSAGDTVQFTMTVVGQSTCGCDKKSATTTLHSLMSHMLMLSQQL